jgi:hypothetical protein
MSQRVAIAIAVLLGLGVESRAHAEDLASIDVGGAAEGAGEGVKQKALDAAFGEAIDKVLRAMLPGDVRTRHKKVLRDDIERRARLYVGSYKILDERRIEGELRLQVTVKVDRDKIRAALAELNIDAEAGGSGGGSRPRVVVLLKYSESASTSTTFGSTGGDGGAGGRAFSAELRSHGFDLIDATKTQAPLGEATDSRLPLGDDAAIELARQLGAGGAFIVGIDTAAEGPVRGTRLVGAAGKASVRVVDTRSGKVIASESIDGAGFGDDADAAIASAASELSTRVLLGVGAAVVRHWPPTRAKSDQLEVRIRGARTWGAIAEIIRQLGATNGVRSVHALRIEGGRIDLAVDATVSAKKIASQIKKAKLRRGRAAVKIDGDRILVKVSGDSRFSGGP